MCGSGDAQDALREARECCRRIASAIEQTSSQAEQLGDEGMLERLAAARAATDRASELIARLGVIIEAKD